MKRDQNPDLLVIDGMDGGSLASLLLEDLITTENRKMLRREMQPSEDEYVRSRRKQ